MKARRHTAKGLAFLAGAVIAVAVGGASARAEVNGDGANAVRAAREDGMEEIVRKASLVRPSRRQAAWQELEFYAFIHFGMNTFTNREWGDGRESPKLFNPTKFDARQWVSACKAAGMRMLILTCKHHDGFCLWPTRYTEHSVRNSPWKGGKGDVVREVSDACRDAGLKFGVYLSPWDRHERTYGDSPAYNRYFRNQLTELLTGYGPIAAVWFDGACAEGPGGRRQEYDWQSYYRLIRKLQPGATIHVRGPDVRWCGNEAGHTRKSEWSVIPIGEAPDRHAWTDKRGADLGSRSRIRKGRYLVWYPAEVNTSIRPGWFYHAREDDRVKPLERLLDIYYGSVGGNATFLLNLPPDRRGLIHENDARRLAQMGKVLRASFRTDLAKGAAAKASAERGADGRHSADKAVDGKKSTYWSTDDGVTSAALELDLGEARTFNCAMLQEAIRVGQRIEKFVVEARVDGKWKKLAEATVVGYKRLLRLPETTARRVRVRVLESRVCPTLRSFALYRRPAVLKAPIVRRSKAGMVTLKAPPGAAVRYTLDGSEPTAASPLYAGPFPLPRGGTVRAISIAAPGSTAIDLGYDTAATAEFGPAKTKWKILACSSEEAPGEAAVHAIDDDPDTIWHSQWKRRKPPHPHTLDVDLGETLELVAFTYLPRSNARAGGSVVKGFAFYVSPDGKNWHKPVVTGAFDDMAGKPGLRTVRFGKPVAGRYVRFKTLSETSGAPYASMAELGVLVADKDAERQ